MKLEFIKYEKRDRIASITLNRPEVMNALHPPCHEELDRVFDDFAADPEVWVAILTGAGDKAFSAGNDLKWTTQHGVPKLPKTGFGVSAQLGALGVLLVLGGAVFVEIAAQRRRARS